MRTVVIVLLGRVPLLLVPFLFRLDIVRPAAPVLQRIGGHPAKAQTC
jgi:hypothetical protein